MNEGMKTANIKGTAEEAKKEGKIKKGMNLGMSFGKKKKC